MDLTRTEKGSGSPSNAGESQQLIRGTLGMAASLASQKPVSVQTIHRATFPLPEGLVALEFPEHLSAESFEDLEAWLQVMLRRARRSVGERLR